MKLRTLIIMSIFTILGSLFGCQAQSDKFKSVSADEFEKCIADTTIVRLDVRTANEYAVGHIAKAVNVDVLQSDFATRAVALLPKSCTVAVYCRSGRRSKMAARILADKGFTVIDLSDGFLGWLKAGKAQERTSQAK
jgi:rhodanese-related sulfurtransferase